jgi:hypothetical protein
MSHSGRLFNLSRVPFYYKGCIVLRVNGTDSVPDVGDWADCLTK